MLPTLAIIGGVLVALIVVLLVLAARKPDTFRIQRATTIQAPPEAVFPLVSDFHAWLGWSPWEKLDPNLKRTHSGPANGTGAVYEWEGNKKVGQGRMEIKEAVTPRRIIIQLDFLKPFEAHNVTEFTMTPEAGGTAVTWAMTGQQPFLFKVMCLFTSMDRMVGKDFERGLANLKALAEK
jgi:uncharacterized protein YndB with AHSA1/START domain